MGTIKHRAVKTSGEVLYASEWNDSHLQDLVLNDLVDVDVPSPMDGDILFFDGVTAKWVNVPVPTRLNEIADILVTSDADYINIDGLDINTHKFYLIIANFYLPAGEYDELFMYVEDDLEPTNYWVQCLIADGIDLTSDRFNDNLIGFLAFNGYMLLTKDKDDKAKVQSFSSFYQNSETGLFLGVMTHTVSSENITSIRFESGSAGNIRAGSRIKIYGFKPTY